MAQRNQPVATEDIATARRLRAMELRLEGRTFRSIGAALGISHEQARQDIYEELARLAERTAEQTAIYRQGELEKLDVLEQGSFPAAMSGVPVSVANVLRIMERRAKLLGLDAPAKVAPTDPSGTEAWQPAAGDLPPHLQAIKDALAHGHQTHGDDGSA